MKNICLDKIKYLKPTREFKLHSLIQNNVIFQSEKMIPIFGKAEPNTVIVVELFNDNTKECYANYQVVPDNGKFYLELPALEASFDTYTLNISDTVHTVEIVNVMIGEVFLLAGQTNMAVRASEMENGIEYIGNNMNKHIHVFFQQEGTYYDDYPYTPIFDVVNGRWNQNNDINNVRTCSGIGYSFACELYDNFQKLGKNVPIGIINSQKGTSSLHAWLPRKKVVESETLKEFVLGKGYSLDDTDWNNKKNLNYNQVSALYNRKIAPLFRYNIKGILWYQGENDPVYKTNLEALPLLIDTYSKGFNKNDEIIPFQMIQLHPYDASDYALGESLKYYSGMGYADHRRAQFDVSNLEKYKDKVNLIPIYDIDLKWDVPKEQFRWPNFITPVTKIPVGKRCADAMMSMCYIKDKSYLAPKYKSHTYTKNSITIKFDNVGEGLVTFKKHELGVTMVEIITKTKKRITVKCKIFGKDKIKIYDIDTSNVEAFSYSNFSRNENSNLANSNLIPAIPFVVNL